MSVKIKVGEQYRLNTVLAAWYLNGYKEGDVVTIVSMSGDSEFAMFEETKGLGITPAQGLGITPAHVEQGVVERVHDNASDQRDTTDLEEFLIEEIFYLLVENSVEFKDTDLAELMLDSFSLEMKEHIVVEWLQKYKSE